MADFSQESLWWEDFSKEVKDTLEEWARGEVNDELVLELFETYCQFRRDEMALIANCRMPICKVPVGTYVLLEGIQMQLLYVNKCRALVRSYGKSRTIKPKNGHTVQIAKREEYNISPNAEIVVCENQEKRSTVKMVESYDPMTELLESSDDD